MEKDKRIKQIRNVTLQGSFINLILTVGKIIAGIVGQSTAMIADGLHSLSDFITDLIVVIFIKVSGKEKDKSHHYGHGKFETFATMLISFALIIVGLGILITGAVKIIDSLKGELIEQPGFIALYAALFSIVFKEGLFWYTKIEGKKLNSQTMIANAWHHRSDTFSSIGTALGILGAILLGERWRILDPIAGVIVSFLILKVAWDIAKPSIDELLDSSLPRTTEKELEEIITKTEGIKNFHNLRTRKIGEIISVEVHIKVDKNMTVELSHQIATEIEIAVRKRFGERTHVIVHIEPFRND
ncbi:cation diffusion facilitator family transporter [Anaerophaga thermohalophila]|jgi:cation diffusion facilitator family transporter|uniref:cation diffusion facilitator family transporter n=1 Tax=Anaerophaga thermohalophila TaxID=177400 RepID=UPI0002F52336|nr:cation diffusion facilitator family transporter [Anaerophaga thermohalophila]